MVGSREEQEKEGSLPVQREQRGENAAYRAWPESLVPRCEYRIAQRRKNCKRRLHKKITEILTAKLGISAKKPDDLDKMTGTLRHNDERFPSGRGMDHPWFEREGLRTRGDAKERRTIEVEETSLSFPYFEPLAARTTRAERASNASALGMTMSWLNRSDSSQTRSLDRQEPRKMKTTPRME